MRHFLKGICYITLLLLLGCLSACNPNKSLLVHDSKVSEVNEAFLEFVFLRGYQIIQRDDAKYLYLVRVKTQEVQEFQFNDTRLQTQVATEQEIDPSVGPPVFLTSRNPHVFQSAENITLIQRQQEQQNTIKNRAVVSVEIEEFGLKLSQVGRDVRVDFYVTSQIDQNPGYYILAFKKDLAETYEQVIAFK